MAWAYILIADIFEIAWMFLVKWATEHVSEAWGGPLATICMGVPVGFLLNAALKQLPAGTVYSAFVGIGAVGTALIGIFFFKEDSSLPRLLSLGLVVVGLVGLKYFSSTAP